MKSVKMGIKTIAVCLAVVLMVTGCGSKTDGEITKISFKSASSYDYLKTLDGKTVTINGYLATSSPADGSFIFLMNLPYQNCPFCVPNTSQLANTLEVYPKNGQKFGYTTQAVTVTGTLECADGNNFFTDLYGYEFAFKLVDAEYKILTDTELTAELALWQEIADSGLVSDLYMLYDYVYFLCAWNTYYCDSYTDADGNVMPGYYLYAADALHFLETQYAECSADGYFEGMLARVGEYGNPLITVLKENLEKAQELAAEARAALENGEYTFENQYVEMFDTYDYIYTINDGDRFASRYEVLYREFSDWIAGWEL